MKDAGISEVVDTIEALRILFPLHKTNKKHRMRQEYSYDVRESETFKNTFKAEEKIKSEINTLRLSKRASFIERAEIDLETP